jgi:hypothetical protein
LILLAESRLDPDEAIRLRTFDPFLMTKEIVRGTFPGLASVWGIIKNHSGIIETELTG